jgi:SAM-dependent methyltransferase
MTARAGGTQPRSGAGSMTNHADPYAKGMVAIGEQPADLTPELDEFQYRMVKPHLGRNILEVGAGTGRIARLLLQDGVEFDRYVINEPSDYFFGQLQSCINKTAKVDLAQGETGDLVRLGPFDSIFSVHVLEHVENDRQFLADCYNMLAPGGRLITLVPALQFLYSDLDRSIGHYRRYDKKMVRRLVEGTGFRIRRLYYTNFVAVFASLIFLKLGKLDYQKSDRNRSRFIALEKIYSKYFIPAIDFMERRIPVPIGLNLTFVLEKPAYGSPP